ncbi:tryptophan synthase subunit alpha [Phytohabitans aurantiacus]|uniref:Tryptophan synthase alpha chain n=1 Tax=Phytohabitans aurantiacus TaxID=3016789 RepID=A0ABQ5R6L9_9ACTN|nr:tryptophan synthase subunit alpha [Phytohabitans aurantiacus]GLI01863.1 tryptophan synthase alpha chain [Phytohabitans aurantiacus]
MEAGFRAAGRKLLMPYTTGGLTDDWVEYLRAFVAAGADAIEVGLPFSDPTLDGPTIQEASDAALARGTTARGILADVTGLDFGVPLVASTYYNLVAHDGPERFCAALRDAGFAGLIVPDLPLDEAGELIAAAEAAGIELALLASVVTPAPRLAQIAERSRGFVYAVSLMGTTGERREVDAASAALVERLKAVTDRPVLHGFGITTPEHAARASRAADGVIVGAALVRRVLDGAGPEEVGGYLATMRRAIDQGA